MSLKLVQTVTPCCIYNDVGHCWTVPPHNWPAGFPPYYYSWSGIVYHPELVTCPKHYEEAFNVLQHFYYDPAADRLHLHPTYNTVYWPGWYNRSLFFAPDTGAYAGYWSEGGIGGGNWYLAYSASGSAGAYGRIYGLELGRTIVSLDPTTARPDGNYSNSLAAWPGSPAASLVICDAAAGLAVLGSGATLNFWRNINTAPEKFAMLTLPTYLDYMCYESPEIMWAIGRDGTILKLNYQIPRLEMISRVQAWPETARKFMITFDNRRHRLAVLRWLADAADGACRAQFEFYYPINQAAYLTRPVPVNSLRTSRQITFVAHLIGEAGEGIAPALVNAELAEPASGRILTPHVTTEASGRLLIRYESDSTGGYTDTIELSVEN